MNIDQFRKDTAINPKRIHLNNAGSSLPPRCVVNRIIEHLRLEENIGGYEAEEKVIDELEDFYREAAKLINAKPKEISYHESATHAWQKFFYSIPLTSSDRIIVFQQEYASFFLALLQQKKRTGCRIDVVPVDESGDICLKTLQEKMDTDVKLVLLTHMPTQSGQLNPAESVGNIVKKHDCIYVVDATQTVGQYPVDVAAIGCDALCATGRKFLRGPRGTGFLYVSENIITTIEPAMIDLRGAQWIDRNVYQLRNDALRFEFWEQSIALKLGLKEALRYTNTVGIQQIWQRGLHLSQKLRRGLAAVKGVTICDPGSVVGNIVTFVVDGVCCDDVVRNLAQKNIAINKSQRSYALLDFDQRDLTEVCRASPHYFNTDEEIVEMLHAMEKIAHRPD